MSSGTLARHIRRLCVASLALLAAAMPAQAFQKTALADGGFEYFFAAPSLDIRGAGNLDFSGLSFIDGVADGFRVGASFNLDWLGGENASLVSSASTWSGLDTQPRSLSITATGNLRFGTTRLSLSEGTISLSAGESLILDNTTAIDVGASGGAVISLPGFEFSRPPDAGALTLTVRRGGDISVIAPNAPALVITSPIPEPTAAGLMLAGLLGLAGVAARRAKVEG